MMAKIASLDRFQAQGKREMSGDTFRGGSFNAGAYINAGDTYGVLIAVNYAVVDGLRSYMTASGVLAFGKFTCNASGEFWSRSRRLSKD